MYSIKIISLKLQHKSYLIISLFSLKKYVTMSGMRHDLQPLLISCTCWWQL